MSNSQSMSSTELGELPESWDVKRFDSLFAVQQGKQVSKKNRVGKNQFPFLRTRNVFWGRLDLADLDKMSFSETEQSRLTLKIGDLLICEGGDIGRTALWGNHVERCYYQNHLHRARVRDNNADPEFFLYWLWYAFEIGNVYFGRGNVTTIPNLSQSKLSELPIPYPNFSEQGKIARVLGLVQKAIEQQERLVVLTSELKKTLMHKLFTEGLHGEPQKETEIGPVPKSWKVVRLDEAYNFTKKPRGLVVADKDKVAFLPMETIPKGRIYVSDFDERLGSALTSGTYIENGDLLIAKITPSFENGKQAIVDWNRPFGYATTEVIPIQEVTDVSDKFFLFHYLLHPAVRSDLAGKMDGTTGRQRLSKEVLGSRLIPLPSHAEQKDIANALNLLSEKMEMHGRKRDKLSELFRTLLHQLMTAQIRVDDSDISFLTSTEGL